MKIEINIDVEALVRDAICKHIQENLVINNIVTGVDLAEPGADITKNVIVQLNTPNVQQCTVKTDTPLEEIAIAARISHTGELKDTSTVLWEYAPTPGKRRSKLVQALHTREIQKGRTLTPEEKKEVQDRFELAIQEQKDAIDAIEAAKNKARIQTMANTATKEAKQELEKEAVKMTTTDLDADLKEAGEPEIPKTGELDLDSMFS